MSNIKDVKLNGLNILSIHERESKFNNNYSIAVISDSHNYYRDLELQIKYINKNKEKIAFVVHTGDATDLGLLVEWEMFYNIIQKLEVPIVMVIGNHDLLTNGLEIYQQLFGYHLDFSFVFKGSNFVFINNNNWESTGDVPDIDYINDELRKTKANSILFSHVSLSDLDRFTKSEVETTKKLIIQNNVGYVINGHDHNHNTASFGNAIQLTTGASVKGYILMIHIERNNIEHDFIRI